MLSDENVKSAFQIIMEELSEEIYLDQLLAFRRQDASIRQSIVLRPESLKDAVIVDFVYLKSHVSLFCFLSQILKRPVIFDN